MARLIPRFGSAFISLRHRDFRYFWMGQCVSTMGTWIQRTAQIWLVYEMTKSAFLVGVLSACQFAPILVLTLFAGSVIDRYPKRTILIITQAGFVVLGFAMTAVVFFGVVQYWQVLLIAVLYGILQSFDNPTRQSFVIELVGSKDLINGISLNSTIFNLAKIVGPSLAGVLMTQFSVTVCFFVDTLSYLAVIAGLFLVHGGKKPANTQHKTVVKDIGEGLGYVLHHADIRLTAEFMLIVCTLAYNQNTILPIYANQVLGQGAQGYATLLSAVGIGSMIAAVLMSYLAKFGLHRGIYIAVALGTCVLQTAMVFIRVSWMAMVVMGLIGFSNMIFLNQSNGAFQFSIPNQLRGRIMSVYVLINQGSTPLGSLYSGTVMDMTSGLWGFPACGILALGLLLPVMAIHSDVVRGWLHRPVPKNVL